MSAPQWSAVEEDHADLLALVALGPLAPKTADEEWAEFVRCLRHAADEHGVIQPNTLRPLVRGVIAPRRIGAFTHRAISQGLVEYRVVGYQIGGHPIYDYQISDDTEGKNAGKPARVMRLLGGTA
jgi:hypothetical protein